MKNEYGWDRLRLTDEEKEKLWQRIGPRARRRWWERVLPSPVGPGRRWLSLRPVPAFVGGAVTLTLAALLIGQFAMRGRTPHHEPYPSLAVKPVTPPTAPTRGVPALPPRPGLGVARAQWDLRAAPRGPLLAERGPTSESGQAAPALGLPQPAPGVPAGNSAVAGASGGGQTGPETPMDATRLEPVTVEGSAYMTDAKSGAVEQKITGDRPTKYAIDSVEDAIAKQSGVVVRSGQIQVRGGRGNETSMRADGQPGQAAPAAPAASDKAARALESAERDRLGRERQELVARQRDLELREREEYEREFRRRCWIPPQDPRFDMMYFRHTGVNPFVRTEADALSTFGLDVDNASYTVTRAYLDRGQLPPEEAVRVEEFVNFFHQDYPPAGRDDFRIVVDGAPSPCHEGYYLLRVGLRARDVRPEDRKPASITLVIDVSGSMARENRLDLVKRAVRVLLDRLDPTDTVGIVTYTTYAQVALEPTRASRQELIESVLDELQPQQTTNLDQGLEFGYRMAREAYRPGAINRIVLCTDGVANEGITTAEGILDHVRREADAGIHLTAIGVGMGNYNDALLEKLADQGDGNYYYVDSMDEARRVFGERLTGTLQTVAKDAKVQVEFDPDTVSRWRLLGYEKRAIADRDFRNEAVDAGEIGAGHQVTALYEVRLADRIEQRDRDRIRDSGSGREERYVEDRLGVVRLRYREPESEGRAAGIVREQEQRFTMADLAPGFGRASDRLRLDAVVAEFAEILRGSYWARGDDLHDVARIADEVASHLGSDSDVQDFARLVRRAASLKLDREVGDR